jgi:hypothetical protein
MHAVFSKSSPRYQVLGPLFAALSAAAVLTACGSEGAPPSGASCIKGQSIECRCSDGALGAQTCNASGSYDRCSCSGSSGRDNDERVASGESSSAGGLGAATSRGGSTGGPGGEGGRSGNGGSTGSGATDGRARWPLGSLRELAAGAGYTCAVTTAGGATCWGRNSFGELGIGRATDSLPPVPVAGLSTGVSKIAVGDGHACVVLDSGTAKCWGSNGFGKLGDGTQASRS